MAQLNLSFEDLASVICLACQLGYADDDFTEDEMTGILKALGEQYNFQGREDLLRQYINAGIQMNPQDALRRVAAFGPEEKQWASNFFVKTIVADGNLEESEKNLYWDIMEKCGLPEHNLDGGNKEPDEPHLKNQVAIAFIPHLVQGDIYDTTVEYVEYPFDQDNIRDSIFEWFSNPETLQFTRRTEALNALNEHVGLNNGWHFVLIYAKPEHWMFPSPNKAASVLYEDPVYGPAILAVEGEQKVVKGAQFRSFIRMILEKLYAIDNNAMVAGENNPELSKRFLVSAISSLIHLDVDEG